jgi:hypothetical protein
MLGLTGLTLGTDLVRPPRPGPIPSIKEFPFFIQCDASNSRIRTTWRHCCQLIWQSFFCPSLIIPPQAITGVVSLQPSQGGTRINIRITPSDHVEDVVPRQILFQIFAINPVSLLTVKIVDFPNTQTTDRVEIRPPISFA